MSKFLTILGMGLFVVLAIAAVVGLIAGMVWIEGWILL